MKLFRGRRVKLTERPSVPASKVSVLDMLDESTSGLFARPGRTALTVLGTVIGLAALVATLGLSKTAGNRIIGRFDELAATEVVVSAKTDVVSPYGPLLPWDGGARMERLNGVVSAATLTQVDTGGAAVTSAPIRDPQGGTDAVLSVWAVSEDAFQTVRADLRSGRVFDAGHSKRADRVVVLGPAAALRLGIDRVDQMPAVAIGDQLYLVIGILDNVARQPELLSSVIIPQGTARRYFDISEPGLVMAETQIGAAPLIAAQSPPALRPDAPQLLKVASASSPERVKDAVRSDLDRLFLLLGAVSLLVGAIGIANVTLVSVMERTGEIGLRRALGATRTQIATQFLMESGMLGLLGGIVGASVGILVVVGVAFVQHWTPVLDAWLPPAAPVVGAVVGLMSGLYPALRAASLEPVDALRAGT